MTNYKFTVNCETEYDTETFNTNDIDVALAKFEDYKKGVEDCDSSEYEILIIDNRTGEIYKHITYYGRQISEEELDALDESESEDFNPVENPFPDSLAADIERYLEEMSEDEFAELTAMLWDMSDE